MRNDEKINAMYIKIGCIFNNIGFWANIQEDDFAITTDLNLNDPHKWVKMDHEEIQTIPPYNQ